MTTKQISRLENIKRDIEIAFLQNKIQAKPKVLEHLQSVIDEEDGTLGYKIINAYYKLSLQSLVNLLAEQDWDRILTFDNRFK